jgi:peptidoglycan-associated lipoprotein
MKRISILFLTLCFSGISAIAQKDNKALKKAQTLFDQEQYFAAGNAFLEVSKDKTLKDQKEDIQIKAAQAYLKGFQYKKALSVYESMVAAGPKNMEVYFMYAEALRSLGQFDAAIAQYNKYNEVNPGNAQGPSRIKEIGEFKEGMNKPTRIKVSNFGRFNTRFHDYGANFYKKNGIVFVSKREEAAGKKPEAGTGEKFSDLFEAFLDKNNKWSSPTPLKGLINSPFNEGAASFTKNGTQAYFSVADKTGKIFLYVSKRASADWEAPEKISFFGDTVMLANPYLSNDGKTLYFSATNAPGGYGGLDIYSAKRKGNGWEDPINLGPIINTSNDESFPVVHESGDLMFASKGHTGYGGYDIFRSSMQDGNWAAPKNVGLPINSTADDIYYIANPSFTRGFLSSNREGTKGGFDVWEWEITPLEFNVLVTVKDDSTGKILPNATVKLYLLPDSSFRDGMTDEKGQFKFKLKSNTDYALLVNKDKYFGNTGSVTTKKEEFSKNFELTIGIAPIPPQTIVLEDILYDLNSANLRPESEKSLNILVDLMRKSPNLRVGIYSHTDSRASDRYNDSLSQARAQSVTNFLINNGIDSARLVPKGLGEQKPYTALVNGKMELLTEAFILKQPKDKQEALFQLNRRTELEVLGSDFEGNIKYKRVSGEEDSKGAGSLFEGRTGGDDK